MGRQSRNAEDERWCSDHVTVGSADGTGTLSMDGIEEKGRPGSLSDGEEEAEEVEKTVE